MKRVVFIRHAKSSWKQPELKDLERPLAKRGVADTKKVGKWLKNNGVLPDLVITSPAKRAIDTANSICARCGYQKEIVVNENLYFKGPSAIFRQINQLSDTYHHVFIVFHNPDINQITIDQLQATESNIPTLGLVFTESIAGSWKNWNLKNSEIVAIVKPKNLTKH
ncbi:MAG: SixA phosphatase family protein [Bacteroidia bacterium]